MKENNYKIYTDIDLINNIKSKSCSDSMTELINRHINIVHSVIHKFCLKNTHIDFNELMEDKFIIFNNAVNSFNSSKKTKFTTWLFYTARFHCLNTNENKDKTTILENSEIDKINNLNNKFQECNSELKENYSYICNLLEQIEDKRINDIFKMRYFDGKGHKLKPWREISKKLNLSIPWVIYLHNQGKALLYNKINSKNKMDTI